MDKSHFAFLLKKYISLIGSDETLTESHTNWIISIRSRSAEQGQNCPNSPGNFLFSTKELKEKTCFIPKKINISDKKLKFKIFKILTLNYVNTE